MEISTIGLDLATNVFQLRGPATAAICSGNRSKIEFNQEKAKASKTRGRRDIIWAQ